MHEPQCSNVCASVYRLSPLRFLNALMRQLHLESDAFRLGGPATEHIGNPRWRVRAVAALCDGGPSRKDGSSSDDVFRQEVFARLRLRRALTGTLVSEEPRAKAAVLEHHGRLAAGHRQ